MINRNKANFIIQVARLLNSITKLTGLTNQITSALNAKKITLNGYLSIMAYLYALIVQVFIVDLEFKCLL